MARRELRRTGVESLLGFGEREDERATIKAVGAVERYSERKEEGKHAARTRIRDAEEDDEDGACEKLGEGERVGLISTTR